MFCPTCGAEYTIELNYCNRCGANLSAKLETAIPKTVVSITKPTLIIGGLLLLVTLGGFGALITGAMALATFLHGNDPLIAMLVFGMLTILVIDIFLIRLLSRSMNAALSPANELQVTSSSIRPNNSPPYLPSSTMAGVSPAPSVTENTTRSFKSKRA